jgi:hypothetical protein
MDVTVTRAPGGEMAWDLTDLLGRPLGRVTEEPGPRFFIDPSGRGRTLMARFAPGPHASLDDALAEIEKHTHGVCRRASEEN